LVSSFYERRNEPTLRDAHALDLRLQVCAHGQEANALAFQPNLEHLGGTR
jgi:hypothetical protein